MLYESKNKLLFANAVVAGQIKVKSARIDGHSGKISIGLLELGFNRHFILIELLLP